MSQHCKANPCCGERPCEGVPLPQDKSGLTHLNKVDTPPADQQENERLQSLAAEKERLRFEGDLDKWMKIIGAGVTGFQPEAYAVMGETCREFVRLRHRVKALENALEPFAQAETADGLENGLLRVSDDHPITFKNFDSPVAEITIGDLRHARATLKGGEA